MNKPLFKIEIIGDSVLPQTVKATDLGALISNWEVAVASTLQREMPLAMESRDAIISLVGIQEGSNILVFAVVKVAVVAVGLISNAISNQSYSDIPFEAQKAIHEISKQANRKGWVVKVESNEELNIKEAVIDDNNSVPAPSYPKAIGTTTLSGQLLRVGGATPRAEVRLRDGRIIYIDVNERQAKELASRLYEEVSIEGRATWNSNDWTIQNFKATRITDYRPGSLVRAFEELASLSEDLWSGVDPVQYVNDLRKED